MKTPYKLAAASLIFLFTAGFLLIKPAYACSGGVPLTVPQLVEYADIVVHGRVLQVDDAHQNAVMQVISYLAGEPGTEHILLSLYTPAQINSLRDRYSSGGCFYGVNSLQSGDEIIIFLKRKVDGSYELAPRHFTNPDYYRFPTDDATVMVYLSSEPVVTENTVAYNTRDVTLAEFSSLIGEAAGTTASAPLESDHDLLFAPLLIAAESGTHYLLPVDGADPVRLSGDDLPQIRRDQPACWTVECVAWSPNGVERAILAADGTITLYLYGAQLTGSAVLFSSTSDALAVWETSEGSTRLLVYTLFSYRIRRMQDSAAELVSSTELNLDGLTPNMAAWSPDGRILAFTDAEGIWLWDALTPGAAPELLLATSTTISGFSPFGRYLIVGEGADGHAIDLVSGEIYPAGAFSPDERILASYEPEFHIIQLIPYNSLEKPPVGSHVSLAAWRDENTYIALTCPDEADRSSCRVVLQSVWVGSNGIFTGYTFDYDAANDTLAIVKDERTITIHSSAPFRVYDRELAILLDEDIASIEWLPSLFYDVHLD